MPGNYEKTLDAEQFGDSREEGKQFDSNVQEGEQTMTSLPRIPAHFDTTINVAGLTVAPGVMTGGTTPDENVVTLTTRDELLSFTPAEACALAAALSAVAVHLLEQADTEQEAA